MRGTALVERRQANISRRRECLGISRATASCSSHLLPNCLPPLIVIGTMQVARAIALEATLSFLGLGVPMTEPSLGHADRQWLRLHAQGVYWISLLSRHRAHLVIDRRHQPGRRPACATCSTRGSEVRVPS
jgi:peptide/nickel transport system permease protein